MTYCPNFFYIIWMYKLMEVNIFHVQSKVAVLKFMHVVVKGPISINPIHTEY